ncbi:hypothetical protein ACFQ0M_20435 [Kitasatospora aburaviensis]
MVKVRYPATWPSWRKRLTSIPALAFLAFIGWSAYVFARGSKGWFESRCSESGACGVLLGFVTPFLSLALAAFVFLVYRRQKIRGPIIRKARRTPHKLVPSAHTAVDQVVGREQLCEVICRSLEDRAARRPYVLVGSVGAGKTAVLVQLTHMLAQQHRVPVPVRLRDVGKDGADLDFRELARKRFAEEADPGGLLSSEQTAKVWRQLCEDGQAVVLADGLEEALASNGNSGDRDNAIRNAIKKAKRQNLPWSSPPGRTRRWRRPRPRSSTWNRSPKRPRSTFLPATIPSPTKSGWTGSSRRPWSASRRCTWRSPDS